MFVRSLALATITVGLLACANPESPTADTPSSTVVVPRGSSDATASAAPLRPAEAHSMLRLDYTLTTTDPGKTPTTAEYTISVEENHPGEINLGRNVPLQVSTSGGLPPGVAPAHGPGPIPSGSARPPMSMGVPRQDVGMKLRCSYQMVGEDFTVHTDLEMSDVVDSSAPVVSIARVTLRGDAPVKAGQSALVSSSEDPGSHRRYQLTVKATRLR